LFFMVDSGMSRGVDNSTGAALRVRKVGAVTKAESLAPSGAATLVWQG
jgi:hypothetical protein